VKARALLAGAITLIVVPFVGGAVRLPTDLGLLGAAVVSELMIGLVFGFCLTALFAALELAGLMIGQQMGLSLAEVFDPLFEEENSVLGQMFFWLALLIFLLINGHHALFGAVIRSFQTVPVGAFMVSAGILTILGSVLQTAFVVGVQVAAPVIVAIFLASLALGFVARTVPQLNILSVGFSLRAVMGFVLVIVCLGAGIDAFMNVFDDVFDGMHWLLGL